MTTPILKVQATNVGGVIELGSKLDSKEDTFLSGSGELVSSNVPEFRESSGVGNSDVEVFPPASSLDVVATESSGSELVLGSIVENQSKSNGGFVFSMGKIGDELPAEPASYALIFGALVFFGTLLRRRLISLTEVRDPA